ncbi:MAG: arabinan endo-1,5-alpha-L-arabinosidase [Actinobacteria bacterium]|nr:arabinan endo-1,5-alpha-L-arabinosidase [Actinomycetota bacterium]
MGLRGGWTALRVRGRAALAVLVPLAVATVLGGGAAGFATASGVGAGAAAGAGGASGASVASGAAGAAGGGAAGASGAAGAGGARTAASVPQPYTFIHDPAMAREGNTYYVFSTGDPAGVIGNGNIQIRTSRNLRSWQYQGTVFAQQPAWITSALGSIPNLWAPDISYFGGLWHLYYAGSSFGSNNSVIGLATTPTLNPASPRYHWTDDGLVFRSTTADDYNAIDPSLVTDAAGAKWLSFGSFWSGIKLISLDTATGKPSSAVPTVYSLAAKPAPDPEEGSGIVYHGGYYYLFVAVDYCCKGISSTYHIQVGRSASITGPYVDASGTAMLNGGGMEVQGTDAGMIGPGSPFVFGPGAGGGTAPLLVYHYYDAFDSGDAWIQIRSLSWVDGWPVTGNPFVPVPGQAGPAGS